MFDAETRSRAYYEGRARLYDLANRAAALLRGVSGTKERRKAIDRLKLGSGYRVLEVAVGTGTNLPLLAERLGQGSRLVGLDISHAMLDRCQRKLRSGHSSADLVEGEAGHLPFASAAFDAVFHHGGLAEFGDRQTAIEEMVRVARSGAKVVICDVGVPVDGKLPLTSRLLLKLQSAYDKPPPLDLVPRDARDVQLTWFHGGGWYLIDFVKP
jgi:ubiquinone/menaquinone biosynthesis C-methylase UbiE